MTGSQPPPPWWKSLKPRDYVFLILVALLLLFGLSLYFMDGLVR